MKRITRRQMLLSSTVAGVPVISGCQSGVFSSENASNDETIRHSVTKHQSVPVSDTDSSGWIHVVATDETYTITYDLIFCTSGEIDVEWESESENMYSLFFEKSDDNVSDCETGTRIRGGGSVRQDFERLQVIVNGETIESIEHEESLPSLYSFPTPVETSG